MILSTRQTLSRCKRSVTYFNQIFILHSTLIHLASGISNPHKKKTLCDSSHHNFWRWRQFPSNSTFPNQKNNTVTHNFSFDPIFLPRITNFIPLVFDDTDALAERQPWRRIHPRCKFLLSSNKQHHFRDFFRFHTRSASHHSRFSSAFFTLKISAYHHHHLFLHHHHHHYHGQRQKHRLDFILHFHTLAKMTITSRITHLAKRCCCCSWSLLLLLTDADRHLLKAGKSGLIQILVGSSFHNEVGGAPNEGSEQFSDRWKRWRGGLMEPIYYSLYECDKLEMIRRSKSILMVYTFCVV